GLQDVHAIDRLVIDDADAHGDGALTDDVEEHLALLRREELRVREPANAPVGPDDDGCRHDRPRQRAAPCLVAARQPTDTGLPRSSLVVIGRRRRRRDEGTIESWPVWR